MNSSGRPVIALDIPSGLDGDSGKMLGDSVRASHTITFAATKTGFSREWGPQCCGKIRVVDIGIPRKIWSGAAKPCR
jgi:NAD(P)H-hydrate epimerase